MNTNNDHIVSLPHDPRLRCLGLLSWIRRSQRSQLRVLLAARLSFGLAHIRIDYHTPSRSLLTGTGRCAHCQSVAQSRRAIYSRYPPARSDGHSITRLQKSPRHRLMSLQYRYGLDIARSNDVILCRAFAPRSAATATHRCNSRAIRLFPLPYLI